MSIAAGRLYVIGRTDPRGWENGYSHILRVNFDAWKHWWHHLWRQCLYWSVVSSPYNDACHSAVSHRLYASCCGADHFFSNIKLSCKVFTDLFCFWQNVSQLIVACAWPIVWRVSWLGHQWLTLVEVVADRQTVRSSAAITVKPIINQISSHDHRLWKN